MISQKSMSNCEVDGQLVWIMTLHVVAQLDNSHQHRAKTLNHQKDCKFVQIQLLKIRFLNNKVFFNVTLHFEK